MQLELTIKVDVSGDFVPETAASRLGDGTWEPGEGPQVGNLKVCLGNQNITDLLDADALECVEDAWLEAYQDAP